MKDRIAKRARQRAIVTKSVEKWHKDTAAGLFTAGCYRFKHLASYSHAPFIPMRLRRLANEAKARKAAAI